MKKKVVSALLCVSMVAASLVGCGDKAADTTTESATETTEDASIISGCNTLDGAVPYLGVQTSVMGMVVLISIACTLRMRVI